MSKLLAVSWTPSLKLLRYVYADAEKGGSLRIINAGEKEILDGSDESPPTDDAEDADGNESRPTIADLLKSLVSELHASKATLLLCVSRGAVDSVTMTVPPASDTELPTLVRNLATRQLSGPIRRKKTAVGISQQLYFLSSNSKRFRNWSLPRIVHCIAF